jgi:hypothetical protein
MMFCVCAGNVDVVELFGATVVVGARVVVDGAVVDGAIVVVTGVNLKPKS